MLPNAAYWSTGRPRVGAVEREQPVRKHRHHLGLPALTRQRREILEDVLGLDLEVRRDLIVVGESLGATLSSFEKPVGPVT